MTLSFTPEIEQFIHSQISSGRYATIEEIILAALKLLQNQEALYQGRFEELRQEVLVGVEEADRGELIDQETVFSQLQARLEQRRAQAEE